MRSMNKVMLVGRLGADPETRTTAGGKDVTSFRMATDRNIKEGAGWRQETEWHRVEAWDWLARTVAQNCKKGDAVAVLGELRYPRFTDKEGNNRTLTRIVAGSVSFLGKKAPSPDAHPEPEEVSEAALEAVEASGPELAAEGGSLPDSGEIPF